MITQPFGTANLNHTYALIEEAGKLFDLGYSVYIEHPIPLEYGKAIVDIYAEKDNQEIIIEIGTLSRPRCMCDKWHTGKIALPTDRSDRIDSLRKAKPKAKIIWVHQWKNWISPSITSEYNRRLAFERYEQSEECKEQMLVVALRMAERMKNAKPFKRSLAT